MENNLNFNDNDLSFEDYSEDNINEAISEITSSLKFETSNNPLLVECKASSKLLGVFRKRQKEIEALLEKGHLDKKVYNELKLELKMIKQALQTS